MNLNIVFFFLLNNLVAFVGPCVETAGLLFARIHVVNSTGTPPKPLGQMDGDDAKK